VTGPEPKSGVWPWVIRCLLALAALAAPIVVLRLVTDADFPDPQKQQRLREVSPPPAQPPP
jgi:hypothetical protein